MKQFHDEQDQDGEEEVAIADVSDAAGSLTGRNQLSERSGDRSAGKKLDLKKYINKTKSIDDGSHD